MPQVRESSRELMARLVQTLLDEGVTAQTFDLDAMPFAQMELFGHNLGQQLAHQLFLAHPSHRQFVGVGEMQRDSFDFHRHGASFSVSPAQSGRPRLIRCVRFDP